VILFSGYVELGYDEGAFAIGGDFDDVQGDAWAASTLVEVSDDVGENGDVVVFTGDQSGAHPHPIGARLTFVPCV
jgi:hypothetical protein